VLRVNAAAGWSLTWTGAALDGCKGRIIYAAWGATFQGLWPTLRFAPCTVGSNACAVCISDANIGGFGGAVTAWATSPSTAATTYGDIGNWNTAAVSNMFETFKNASDNTGITTFNQQDISQWNTASVTTMASLLEYAPAFNADIGKWNTASVSNMKSAFSRASAFNQDISQWNTAAVSDRGSIFNGVGLSSCNKGAIYRFWGAALLSSYPEFGSLCGASCSLACLTNANIRAAVTEWVANPTTASTTYGPFGDWDVSAVSNMHGLFANKTTFNADVGKWNVASVSTMASMFSGASAFNSDVSKWNVVRVANFASAFDSTPALTNCSKRSLYGAWGSTLQAIYPTWLSLCITDGNIATSVRAWIGGDTATYGSIADWNTATVTSLYQVFKDTPTFNADISKWNVASVSNMQSTFQIASRFDRTLVSWNVSSVTDFSATWTGANALSDCNKKAMYGTWRSTFQTAWPGFNVATCTLGLLCVTCISDSNIAAAVTSLATDPTYAMAVYGNTGDWNTAAVTSLASVFKGTSGNPDISKWNVAAVTNMYHMFDSAINFGQNLAAWNVLCVANFASAFDSTPALSTVNKRLLYVAWGSTFRAAYPLFYLADANIQTAVTAWATSPTTAMTTCGPISDWDVSAVSNMQELFANKPTFNADVSKWNVASVSTMASTFSGASAFNSDVSKWNVASASTMASMLSGASAFNSDVSKWNVASASTMASTFLGASAFNQPISQWNVARVSNLMSLFSGASVFNGDVSSWNTASAVDMASLFTSALAFNQPIGDWNTAAVTSMHQLFSGASAFDSNVGRWNVASVGDLTSAFNGASAFNGDISQWNVASASIMASLFSGATAFNADIARWNTARVTSMTSMYDNASAFNQNISQWNTARVETMAYTFRSATRFNGNLAGWNVLRVTTLTSAFDSTTLAFSDCNKRFIYYAWGATLQAAYSTYGSLYCITDANIRTAVSDWIDGNTTTYGNLGDWNTAAVTSMYQLFSGASAFNSDVSRWNVASVGNLTSAFNGASSFNGDISKWNVASASSMYKLFSGATAFNADVGRWNVARVSNVTSLFSNATAFDADVGRWNVARLTSFSSLFSGASAFNADVSGWNVASATTLDGTFSGASAFNQNLASWNVASVKIMAYMFNATKLFNQNVACWSVATVTSMSSIFADPISLDLCNKAAIWGSWGTTLQAAHPGFKAAVCDLCGLVTANQLIVAPLANNLITGMVSEINVTIDTSGLPTGTLLGELQASPSTALFKVPFSTGTNAALGSLPSTGDWNASFTLVTGGKLKHCDLPVQSITCMPKFVRTLSGSCACPQGYRNSNGDCVPGEASVCDTAQLSFTGSGSGLRLLTDEQDVDDSMLLSMTTQSGNAQGMALRMQPTAGSRSASMSDAGSFGGLLLPGRTPTGKYELVVSDKETNCQKSRLRINVRCRAGYSAFPEGTNCMANLDPRKCNVTVKSSSGKDVVNGVQVEAGEKLTVRFAAFDVDGQPINRPNLGLELNISGRFNGANSMPLQLVENGTVYEAQLPEVWIREPEPEPVVITLRWLPCESPDCPKLVSFKVIEPSKQKLILGGVAGGLAVCVLLATVYLFAKHGARAKGIVLAIVQKDAKMVWSLIGEVFDLSGDTVMFLAILADANDPLRRAKVENILVVVWVSFSLSVVISVVSLVVKGGVALTALRRRRSSLQTLGCAQSYGRALAVKIEDAESKLKEVSLRLPRRRCALPVTRALSFFATCRCTSASPSPSSRTSRWRASGCTT
jgi:surface protein